MHATLILTDDPSRGQRLARNLGGGPVAVHDLYGEEPVPTGAGLIVSDVSAMTSESILRLRRALAGVRGGGVPLLYLIHGNFGRGEIQATALGATRVLPASIATAALRQTAGALHGDHAGILDRAVLAPQVEAARAAFAGMFGAREAPAPALVDGATAIVNRAIRDMHVRDWLDMVARFDDVTHRHCLLVAGLAAAFAGALGLNAADTHHLTKGALLHDIGKAQVSLTVLNKPGPLDPDERREMERHPELGHAMLVGGAYDATILAVVRSHHEYLDGSGYPDGLRGGDISDLVRLITICDIFAALIERRPYKAPKSAAVAYRILGEMTGRLDIDLVRAFGPIAAASAEPERRSA